MGACQFRARLSLMKQKLFQRLRRFSFSFIGQLWGIFSTTKETLIEKDDMKLGSSRGNIRRSLWTSFRSDFFKSYFHIFSYIFHEISWDSQWSPHFFSQPKHPRPKLRELRQPGPGGGAHVGQVLVGTLRAKGKNGGTVETAVEVDAETIGKPWENDGFMGFFMMFDISGWWWLEHDWLIFPETLGNGIIIPMDEFIFFRGVGIPPTSSVIIDITKATTG